MVVAKHIPVSEQTWKQLGKMKEAGQTYDQLLQQLLWQSNRGKLAVKARDARAGKGMWVPIEEA